MTTATLSHLPDWPALMDVQTAVLYLGGKPKLLEGLIAGGFVHRFTDMHKCVTYRRTEIDDALLIAAAAAASTGQTFTPGDLNPASGHPA